MQPNARRGQNVLAAKGMIETLARIPTQSVLSMSDAFPSAGDASIPTRDRREISRGERVFAYMLLVNAVLLFHRAACVTVGVAPAPAAQ